MGDYYNSSENTSFVFLEDGPELLHFIPRFGEVSTMFLVFFHTFIFGLGVVGNSVVIFLVVKTLRLRVAKNIFIFNLALSDLIISLICVPTNLSRVIFRDWIMGSLACKYYVFFHSFAVQASIHSLVAISIERYATICCGLNCPPLRRLTAIKLIILIWTFSLLLSGPLSFFARLDTLNLNDHHWMIRCNTNWPDKRAQFIYFISLLFLQFIGPFIVIFTCFLLIFGRILRRGISGFFTGPEGNSVRRMHRETNLKVLRILLTMVLSFIILWLPFFIFLWVHKTTKLPPEDENNRILWLTLTKLLGLTLSAINPFLYNFQNKKFREGFTNLFNF